MTKGETARKAITRLKVILKHAVAMGLDVDLQATDKAQVLLGKSRAKTAAHSGAALAGGAGFLRLARPTTPSVTWRCGC